MLQCFSLSFPVFLKGSLIFVSHSFNLDQKNYADAQEFCETTAMNRFTTGRLFEPMTQSFNDKVITESLIVLGRKRRPWIGIKRKGDHWIYSSSGTKLKFQNWVSRRGKPAKRRNCVQSYLNTGEWVDYFCAERNFFICEFV